MAQVTSGMRAILSSPHVYSLFQNLMGARTGWAAANVEHDIGDLGANILLDKSRPSSTRAHQVLEQAVNMRRRKNRPHATGDLCH